MANTPLSTLYNHIKTLIKQFTYLKSEIDTALSLKIDTPGIGLSKNGTTLNHSNSITAQNSNVFKKFKYDGQGHITGTANVSASDLPSNIPTSKITGLSAVATSNDYEDLDNKPSIPSKTSDLTNDSGYLTQHQDISGKENASNKTSSWNSTPNNTRYPTEKLVKDSLDGKASSTHTHGNISNTGTISNASSKNVVTDSNGKITTEDKPFIPSKTSDLTNDSGFLTAHQDISGKSDINHGHGNITKDGVITGQASKNVVTDSNGKITTENKYSHPTYSNVEKTTSGLYKIKTNSLGHIIAIESVAKSDITSLGIPSSDTVYTHPSYAARTGKPIANQTPAFGGTATVSQITSDASGHVTGATDRTIKIPDTLGDGTTAGLSTNDYTNTEKTKLSGIAEGANNYTHPSGTSKTGNPTANQSPGFGGNFKVTQFTSNATGHISGATDRTITLPSLGTTATTACAGDDSRLSDARTPIFNLINASSSNVLDLNDYKTGGFYYTNSDKNKARYIRHCPNSMTEDDAPFTSNTSFFLLVETWGTSVNYVKQTLTYYNDNKTYIRTCSDGTWKDWVEISKDTTYAADNSTLQLSGTTFSVKDGGVTSAKIADGTIVNGDIANTTIQGGKLVNETITATQLASNAVETAKIKNANVTTEKIANDAVTNVKLADKSNLITEYIVGTHGTTATPTWTGTSTKISSLAAGQVIYFKMTSAGTSAGNTLNLTLADGTTTTGAKNIYYNASTKLTTHFPINTILCLVYDGTNWLCTEIQNTNSTYTPASATPTADTSSGTVGTSAKYAREDHVHPKSSLYAEASHTHNTLNVQTINAASGDALSNHTSAGWYSLINVSNFTDAPESVTYGYLENKNYSAKTLIQVLYTLVKNTITNIYYRQKYNGGNFTAWTKINYIHPTIAAGTNYNGNQTPTFGGTFNIPKLTFNSEGHITASANSTVKIPALPTASTSQAGIIKLGTGSSDAAAGNHTHTKSNISDWGKWQRIGSWGTSSGWNQTVYCNGMFVYAIIKTGTYSINSTTWVDAGSLQADAAYRPPNTFYVGSNNDVVVKLNTDGTIQLASYSGTKSTYGTGNFIYPYDLSNNLE